MVVKYPARTSAAAAMRYPSTTFHHVRSDSPPPGVSSYGSSGAGRTHAAVLSATAPAATATKTAMTPTTAQS
jgi:hypothetical protein